MASSYEGIKANTSNILFASIFSSKELNLVAFCYSNLWTWIVLYTVSVGLSFSIRANPAGLWQYRYLTPDITNESLGVPTPFVYLYKTTQASRHACSIPCSGRHLKQFKLEMQKILGLKCSYSCLELEMQSRQLAKSHQMLLFSSICLALCWM